MKVNIGNYPKHRFYHNWLYDLFGIEAEQKVKVKVEEWDTWNMDTTLAYIVVPMLKQLKESKHGYPSSLPNEAAWDLILDKMIFSFNSKLIDWEEQFQSGEHHVIWTENEDGSRTMEKGPDDTFEIDTVGMEQYRQRISEGFKLFGKYYDSLWD